MLPVCGELNPGSLDLALPRNDIRKRGDFRDRWLLPVQGQVDTVRQVLTREGRTLAQGTLAWVWARSDRTVPIPGFKTVKQVEENVAAREFGPLSDEQMKQIDELLDRSR